MIQQDYIMRLIREFFKALERLLGRKDPVYQQEAIKEMYPQYVGDYTFYQTASLEEIMKAMEQYPEEQRIHRLEMLAELYYVESGLKSLPISNMLLEKALAIFKFIDGQSRTYSFDRLQKIDDIVRRIQSAPPTSTDTKA